MQMDRFTLMVSSGTSRTRLLLLDGRDELMRAVLPPGQALRQRRAPQALLEGLALWLDRPVRIVLSADEADASFYLGLVDDLGCPVRSVFYEVEVAEPAALRRGRRLRGVGDFTDLRQLSLLPGAGAGR
jgi:hypothetical protein